MVSKVLKVLAREGLLVSHRGTKGGYSIARRPEDISVAEIIRALEGPIAITECTDILHGDCDLELLCPVRGNWHRINQAIREALEGISLAEMTQPLPSRLVSLRESSNPAQVSNIT
jgi:Rrf2 family protein